MVSLYPPQEHTSNKSVKPLCTRYTAVLPFVGRGRDAPLSFYQADFLVHLLQGALADPLRALGARPVYFGQVGFVG